MAECKKVWNMCCGVKNHTPFCPECGSKLKEPSPLLTLLAHAKRTYSQRCLDLDKRQQWVQEILGNNENPSHRQRMAVVRAKEIADMWQSCVNALEDLTKGKE